jgi:biotin operon repressor
MKLYDDPRAEQKAREKLRQIIELLETRTTLADIAAEFDTSADCIGKHIAHLRLCGIRVETERIGVTNWFWIPNQKKALDAIAEALPMPKQATVRTSRDNDEPVRGYGFEIHGLLTHGRRMAME